MQRHTILGLTVLLWTTLLACGGNDAKGSGKDRGSASMVLDDASWEAERAKAKVMNGSLRLNFTAMHSTKGVTTRQELKLVLRDYDGPGTYTAAPGVSMYVSVAVNVGKLRDNDSPEAVKDMLGGVQNIPMMGAQVVVDSDEDGEVRGSFTKDSSPGATATVIAGEFRALMSE